MNEQMKRLYARFVLWVIRPALEGQQTEASEATNRRLDEQLPRVTQAIVESLKKRL
ncbi:hypothetical protein PCO31010_00821 [Pandoraea commovens]|uniref:Uncharacterized protein n=1 Tax=Pandoraea commovens TaxID=2508289 RepID=A0A5E4SIN2_9BURK|nr:hypothetical protein PCO31010_00821 [Pandoraea commovens]